MEIHLVLNLICPGIYCCLLFFYYSADLGLF
uniref:Uncharacterized protein n=1 Tax=Arundo donax TaxID=35708 RepID=A0A0A8ZZB7_ARUDO